MGDKGHLSESVLRSTIWQMAVFAKSCHTGLHVLCIT